MERGGVSTGPQLTGWKGAPHLEAALRGGQAGQARLPESRAPVLISGTTRQVARNGDSELRERSGFYSGARVSLRLGKWVLLGAPVPPEGQAGLVSSEHMQLAQRAGSGLPSLPSALTASHILPTGAGTPVWPLGSSKATGR